MPYRLPPLSTLRTFDAAARHLSFKRAAEELCVTPAAVSQQVKTLETHLGVALFLRHQKGLQLTEAGLAMHPKIREGLDCFSAGIEATRLDGQLALNLSAPPSFATRWLVPRLPRFSSAHPDVAIRISSLRDNIDGQQGLTVPAGATAGKRSEGIDVAIRFGTGQYPGYQVRKIVAPEFVMVCSPRLLEGTFPLLQPEDLRHQTLIHDESIPLVDMRPSWDEWLKLADVSGVDSERGPRFSNSLMALEAALEGQGVALALKPLIEADLAAGRLVIPFDISMPSAYVYFLVTAKSVAEKSIVLAFEQWLQTEINAR
ncbi:transcriptional regulator GcvA [Dechloromonas sp. TW-R-39-2]|uniref:transcriptional regulator GcvA n=1 Tax=Dechloromonas sp. TW-R-39-2 TaxID=2654218 RepID=UPI00193D336A|nr:transcriptional regulator GcvA [Dechloromonas sp. TW-R-39-2]QRM19876.1 transcriptional regulator GcvA [Dechloromonas sp. TW-R-39-2]